MQQLSSPEFPYNFAVVSKVFQFMWHHRFLRVPRLFGSAAQPFKSPAKSAHAEFCLAILATFLGVAMAGCGRPEESANSDTADARVSAANQAESTESPPTSADDAQNPFSRRLPAPSLDGGLEWLNTEKPLSLADLRGKFVLLDFWTYCCINCMHVLPELKQLEQAYPNELVVIGVHSAKFENEQETQNIREAVLRYEIEHPVVNDGDLEIWARYGVRSWPTLVLIDPVGDVVWVGRGEQTFDQLRAPLELGIPFYRKQGLLRPSPSPVVLESKKQPDTPLKFPGKVLADAAGSRLFIADSNHNRIVVANLDGHLKYVIGTGAVGHADGPFDQCTFNHPQGMALVDDVLWVADTENHLLRKVDLATQQVTTAAGTGEPGTVLGSDKKSAQKSTPLNSPWALWAHDGTLYIAMAGTHQIWKMPLDESHIELHAGSGREDIVDGRLAPSMPYDAASAAFAQPSGLASDGTRLLVADSEGSVIRSVPFDTGGQVETLLGPTGNLFDFGDVDGTGREVRLQHPLGVAFYDGKLYVADTYNDKIKVIDVPARSSQTLAGSGQPGHNDATDGAQASFNEPGGLAAAGDRLFVADTNNHAIRVVSLGEGHSVTTLEIEGLTPPEAEASPAAK
jgi:thiol-disulfide isomerase/thioredoxin